MSNDDIKDLAYWAVTQGAVYVKIGDFEMTLSGAPRVVATSNVDYDPWTPDEDPEVERLAREASYKLLTHSG